VVSALLELVKAAPDVRSAKPQLPDETPLHLAARKGDVGMCRALLQHGATADARTLGGLTPLLCCSAAAYKGSFHHLAAAELIQHGASIIARDHNGDTPMHLACDTTAALPMVHSMCGATKERDATGLGDAVESLNAQGEGVLHRAIQKKEAQVARMLLDAGARSDARSSSGDTAMHCAARAGLEDIATMLLDTPAKALNASNLAGETPLFLAMSRGTGPHARVARMLLASGAHAFGRTRNGESVLHACAREGNAALAALVLSRGGRDVVDVLNAKSNTGGTPLHVAVNHNQEEMVSLLLGQAGLDRGACDTEGNTAVQIACQRGDVVLLQRLLRAGRTGAAVGRRELSVRNSLGWAPLHTSAFYGQDTAVRLLLRFQAPVEHRTADGWTALHLACSEGHLEVVKTLLASNALLDAQHPSGESPLGLAAARGRHNVIGELLRAGASPSAQADEHGWTPMHAALMRGEADIALTLLEKGGRIRTSSRLPVPPRVGEPIDLAHPDVRGVITQADEERRRRNRLEGRDSDDGDEWGGIGRGPEDPPYAAWPPPPTPSVQLLLPDPVNYPYEQKPALRPDRSGLFGYFGDPLLRQGQSPATR
jgi:ankyrin repeat protein